MPVSDDENRVSCFLSQIPFYHRILWKTGFVGRVIGTASQARHRQSQSHLEKRRRVYGAVIKKSSCYVL